MLPSSLEHDDTICRRVDDFWWSFPSLHLESFMSILSHMLHSFTLPLCHLLFFLGILIGLSAPLIISSLQGISRQHIPKGVYKWLQLYNIGARSYSLVIVHFCTVLLVLLRSMSQLSRSCWLHSLGLPSSRIDISTVFYPASGASSAASLNRTLKLEKQI